jgi:hypothetical protein
MKFIAYEDKFVKYDDKKLIISNYQSIEYVIEIISTNKHTSHIETSKFTIKRLLESIN